MTPMPTSAQLHSPPMSSPEALPTPYDIVAITPVAYSLSLLDWLIVASVLCCIALLISWLGKRRARGFSDTITEIALGELRQIASQQAVSLESVNAIVRRYLSASLKGTEVGVDDFLVMSSDELKNWLCSKGADSGVTSERKSLVEILISIESRRFLPTACPSEEIKVYANSALSQLGAIRQREIAVLTQPARGV
jgi:hypothetical protein